MAVPSEVAMSNVTSLPEASESVITNTSRAFSASSTVASAIASAGRLGPSTVVEIASDSALPSDVQIAVQAYPAEPFSETGDLGMVVRILQQSENGLLPRQSECCGLRIAGARIEYRFRIVGVRHRAMYRGES